MVCFQTFIKQSTAIRVVLVGHTPNRTFARKYSQRPEAALGWPQTWASIRVAKEGRKGWLVVVGGAWEERIAALGVINPALGSSVGSGSPGTSAFRSAPSSIRATPNRIKSTHFLHHSLIEFPAVKRQGPSQLTCIVLILRLATSLL